MKIIGVRAIEVLDSRGNPTIKAFVTLDDGSVGAAFVPSGASTGSHEDVELRDSGDHYLGKGVMHAVGHVNGVISQEIRGLDINHLDTIDKRMIELDGTENKSNLGANAILAVSLACARAFALHHRRPLWEALNEFYFEKYPVKFPRLMVNIINGGLHADWIYDIQEFMVIPRENIPSSSVEIADSIFQTLRKILHERDLSIEVGDEGGFAPKLSSNSEAFELIEAAISEAGYTRNQVDLGTDIAASEIFHNGTYLLQRDGKLSHRTLSSGELSEYYESLIEQFNILSFEDPFHEDDWFAFTKFTEKFGKNHLIVGDDLFTTNVKRIKQGIQEHAANTLLVKVNQIGSLFESVQAILLARKAGWKVVISHRSGETEDPFISDLAVACGADFIKAGSMSRSERLAKYNRLLEIEKVEL